MNNKSKKQKKEHFTVQLFSDVVIAVVGLCIKHVACLENGDTEAEKKTTWQSAELIKYYVFVSLWFFSGESMHTVYLNVCDIL